MFTKVLLCTDGSDSALKAARLGVGIARRFGARTLALSVYDSDRLLSRYTGWDSLLDPDTIEHYADRAQDAVEQRTLCALQDAGIPIEPMRDTGHPVARIVHVAQQEQADLIVMGSHGLGGFAALMLGSVSDGVLHHAPCPVLIMHGEYRPLHRILLASDGSESAQKATVAAGALARKIGASLTVLNVCTCMADFVAVTREKLDAALNPRSEIGSAGQPEAATPDDTTLDYALREDVGHPAETILRVAEEGDYGLIVLGSRGIGTYRSLLLGSVSDRVARHACCPVLIVR